MKIFKPMEDKDRAETLDAMGIAGRERERRWTRNMLATLHTFHCGGTLLTTGCDGSGVKSLGYAIKGQR